MKNNTLFAVFDEIKGPKTLYSSLEADISKQLVVKAFIAIGAMEENQDLHGRSAVVPFPGLGLIAFFSIFKVPVSITKSGSSWATIGYIGPSAESIAFYRNLPQIQGNLPQIIEQFRIRFNYDGTDSLIDETLINDLRELAEAGAPESQKSIAENLFTKGDLKFLSDYFGEQVGKIIYPLMLEQPVLIIGDVKDIVEKTLHTIEDFFQHRTLKRTYLNTYVDPKGKDLLISSSQGSYLRKYKNIPHILISERKVTDVKIAVPSINQLIILAADSSKKSQQEIIKAWLDKILNTTTKLMQLCEQDQISREEIKNFRADLQYDELNIVISMVKRYAPHFEGKLFHFARSLV